MVAVYFYSYFYLKLRLMTAMHVITIDLIRAIVNSRRAKFGPID